MRTQATTEHIYGADGARVKKTEKAGTGLATTTAYLGPVEIRNFGQGLAEEILTYPHDCVRLLNGNPKGASEYL